MKKKTTLGLLRQQIADKRVAIQHSTTEQFAFATYLTHLEIDIQFQKAQIESTKKHIEQQKMAENKLREELAKLEATLKECGG